MQDVGDRVIVCKRGPDQGEGRSAKRYKAADTCPPGRLTQTRCPGVDFAGGLLLERWSLRRALWTFGVLQGLGALGFLAIALGWHGFPALVTAVAAENFTSGLGTGAFVAMLMALCDRHFSATQYALFSALDSAARIFVGPLAGYIAADYGWVTYFVVSLVCALPGLALLGALNARFADLERPA